MWEWYPAKEVRKGSFLCRQVWNSGKTREVNRRLKRRQIGLSAYIPEKNSVEGRGAQKYSAGFGSISRNVIYGAGCWVLSLKSFKKMRLRLRFFCSGTEAQELESYLSWRMKPKNMLNLQRELEPVFWATELELRSWSRKISGAGAEDAKKGLPPQPLAVTISGSCLCSTYTLELYPQKVYFLLAMIAIQNHFRLAFFLVCAIKRRTGAWGDAVILWNRLNRSRTSQ